VGTHCCTKYVSSSTERENPHSIVGIRIEHYFTHKPEMWEGTRRWIKLHNEELHDL
jgi:hypothetical protein